MKYEIKPILNKVAQDLVIKNHYLHRKTTCSFAFGLFLNDCIKGVIIYGTPLAPTTRNICGKDNNKNVIELSRLWIEDGLEKNLASYLIGNTLKKVNKEIIVSFADDEFNHIGIVYQATNFLYLGVSPSIRKNLAIRGKNIHFQTLFDKYKTVKKVKEVYGDKVWWKPRSKKHRYVYFNCSKGKKKYLIKKLKYNILPYPTK